VIDGEDVAFVDPVALRRRIGYVIQQIGLFPHLTVGANVATIPRLLGWSRARQQTRIEELLDLVGLEPAVYRDRYPHELSGGQQQRVGVARALGADPPLLLMDEPFGALDPITRLRLQDELLAIQAGVRKTIVFVTHDIDEAIKIGDRIAILAGDGTLAQHATARELLASPSSPFVSSFVGADRALLLLSVTPIERTMLQPIEPRDRSAPSIGSKNPVGEAFALMVLHGTDRVLVVDGDADEPLGVLTADAIARHCATPQVDHSEE
jgi:osmoprotectant transport system ATP-binding protein